ncbi:MAG: DinB family protein [Fibrobacteria bacterium]
MLARSGIYYPSVMADSQSLPFTILLRDFSDLRAFTLKFLMTMEAEEAMRIPEGFRNNLHWQLGHLLYTQDVILFEGCGMPSPFPSAFPGYFGMGTSPRDYDPLIPDWDELLALARRHHRSLPEQVTGHLHQPLPAPRKLMNISMLTAGDTLPFLLAHEGEHLGHIKRLRKFLRPD